MMTVPPGSEAPADQPQAALRKRDLFKNPHEDGKSARVDAIEAVRGEKDFAVLRGVNSNG
jgi:hypothetical protein